MDYMVTSNSHSSNTLFRFSLISLFHLLKCKKILSKQPTDYIHSESPVLWTFTHRLVISQLAIQHLTSGFTKIISGLRRVSILHQLLIHFYLKYHSVGFFNHVLLCLWEAFVFQTHYNAYIHIVF